MDNPLGRAITLLAPLYGRITGFLRHEHLPNFCFHYRHVDHTPTLCKFEWEDNNGKEGSEYKEWPPDDGAESQSLSTPKVIVE